MINTFLLEIILISENFLIVGFVLAYQKNCKLPLCKLLIDRYYY